MVLWYTIDVKRCAREGLNEDGRDYGQQLIRRTKYNTGFIYGRMVTSVLHLNIHQPKI